MNCPFLQETRMRYCRRAGPRILIPRGQPGLDERCTTDRFVTCPAYSSGGEQQQTPPCPLLQESLMQYCSAAAVTKFIPYSEAILSRCGNGSFQYCDLYLQLAGTNFDSSDTIPLNENACYTTNHLWMDLSSEGQCHIGIDAFLARMLGNVEAVGYLSNPGMVRPAAVLTSQGVDFQVVFPEKVSLTACNLYLRAEPSRLTSQPYTAGWLFEASLDPVQRARFQSRLMTAAAARTWMDEESRRINESLQSQVADMRADGGLFARGLLSSLSRQESLCLFHEFCPPTVDREDTNA